MTFPEVLLLAIVLLVGVPAATRNATAAALVGSYLIYEAGWLLSLSAFSFKWCVMIDFTVIAVTYCKAPVLDCFPYRDFWHQLCSFWLERSLWDRLVILIFPVMWAAYVLPLSDFHRWWALWILAIGQFLAAGGEALQSYLSARSAGDAAPDSSAGFEFRWIRGRERYG